MKKLYTINEAQELWTNIVKKRANELNKELKELKVQKNNTKMYV